MTNLLNFENIECVPLSTGSIVLRKWIIATVSLEDAMQILVITLPTISSFFSSKSLRTRSYSVRAHVKKGMAYEGEREKEHVFFASLPSRAIFLAHVSGERSMNAPL